MLVHDQPCDGADAVHIPASSMEIRGMSFHWLLVEEIAEYFDVSKDTVHSCISKRICLRTVSVGSANSRPRKLMNGYGGAVRRRTRVEVMGKQPAIDTGNSAETTRGRH